MTVEEFRRLLFAGHGRALVYLQDHGSAGLEDIIIEAALSGPLNSVEDVRIEYYLDLLRLSRLESVVLPQLKVAVLEPNADESWHHKSHRKDLLEAYARQGVVEADSVLRALFEQSCLKGKPADYSRIIELDGVGGYYHVLERIAVHALKHDGFPDVAYEIHRSAYYRIGSFAETVLQEAARRWPALLEFTGPLHFPFVKPSKSAETSEPRKLPEDMLPYSEYKLLLRDPKRRDMKRWSAKASAEYLVAAAADIPDESNPVLLANLLRFFWERDFPGDPLTLLPFFHHGEERVCKAATGALARFSHEQIRRAALRRLSEPIPFTRAVQLLELNYEAGDDALILDLLNRVDNMESFHILVLHALQVMKRHEGSWDEAMLHIYEKVPCGECRWSAVKRLGQRRLLTPEMIRECKMDRYDLLPSIAEKYEAGKVIR